MTGLACAIGGAMNGPVSVTLTPGNVDDSGFGNNYTFSQSITIANGIASSYAWSFSASSGGWGPIIGNGTANVNITCNAPINTYCEGTLSCSVVVNGITYVRSCSLKYFHEDNI